jgi:hypothetical protein
MAAKKAPRRESPYYVVATQNGFGEWDSAYMGPSRKTAERRFRDETDVAIWGTRLLSLKLLSSRTVGSWNMEDLTAKKRKVQKADQARGRKHR